jgi:hypothetical protein
VHEVVVEVQTTPDVVASVTLYPVISAPPFAGADHVRVIEASPNVGTNAVTWDGAVAGTAAFEIAASPRPASVIATTLNVYEVPFVSSVTTHVVSPVVAHLPLLPLDVTR